MERYVPNRKPPDPLGDLARAARDALTPPDPPPPAPPRGPGITAWYLIGGIVAGQYDVRTMDYATRFAHRIIVSDRPRLAFPELMVPVRPVIQNLTGEPVEIVFSPIAEYGDGIRIPGHSQWTPEGISAIPLGGGGSDVAVTAPTRMNPGAWGPLLVTGDALDPVPVVGSGTFDVSDRVGRLLGIIASITAAVDVSDRAGRLIGAADVTDRAARLLGVIASITAPVDVSDRAGRSLGVVASVTAPVDVSDRAARALGVIASITAAVDVSDRIGRLAGVVAMRTQNARVRVVIKFVAVAPAVADTLLSLVKQTAGVDAAGATSIGVTAAKILRITGGVFSIKAGAAAAAFATLTMRSNPAAATVLASPPVMRLDLGNTAAVIGAGDKVPFSFGPDGLEYAGAETVGASLAAQAVTNIMSIHLFGYEYTP